MDLDKLEETLRNQDETHNYVDLSISAYWFQRLRITDLDAPVLTEEDIEEDFLYIPDPYKVRRLSVEIYLGQNEPQYFEGAILVTLPPKLPAQTERFNKTKTPSTKLNLDALKANKSLGIDDFLNVYSQQKQTSSSTDVVVLPCIKTRKVAATKQRNTRKVKAKPNYFKPESLRVELVKPIPKVGSPKKDSLQPNLTTSNISKLFLPPPATKRPSKGKTLTPTSKSIEFKQPFSHEISKIIHASRVDDGISNSMGYNPTNHQHVVIDMITRTQDSSKTITSTTETMTTIDPIENLGCAPDTRLDDTCSSGSNYSVPVNSSLYTSIHKHTNNPYTSLPLPLIPCSTSSKSPAPYSDLHKRTSGLRPLGRISSSCKSHNDSSPSLPGSTLSKSTSSSSDLHIRTSGLRPLGRISSSCNLQDDPLQDDSHTDSSLANDPIPENTEGIG